MTIVVFLLVGLGLIVLQTAILPLFGALDGCYDLLVPLIVFLGLKRSAGQSLPVVVALGWAIDILTGAPPGYYLTAYLWIWALVRWLISFLRVAGTFLLPLVTAGGVLVENVLLLVLYPLLSGGGPPAGRALETVAWQMLWALLTGPILVALCATLHRRLKRYRHQLDTRRAVRE